MVENKDEIIEKMESIFLRRASIKRSKFNLSLNLEEILDENPFKMGHILFDLHEAFKIRPVYKPLSEFEVFKTPKDIYEYINEQTKQQKHIA